MALMVSHLPDSIAFFVSIREILGISKTSPGCITISLESHSPHFDDRTGNAQKTGLLFGKKAICAYLNNISENHLKKLIEKGMPVLIKDGRWLAHKENIEEFL